MSSQCIHITPSLPPGSRLGEPAPVDPFTPGSLPFAPGCGYHGPRASTLELRAQDQGAPCQVPGPERRNLWTAWLWEPLLRAPSCELRAPSCALRAGRRARSPGLRSPVPVRCSRGVEPGAEGGGARSLGLGAWGRVLGARGSELGAGGPRATGCAPGGRGGDCDPRALR